MKMNVLVSGLVPALLLVACLMTASGEDKQTQADRRDRLRIAAQQICPVSGEKLGSHGEPIKVAIGAQKEEVFLCCKACMKGKLNPQHWKTIHLNFANAQAKCPVMGHDLPAEPKWTIVDGKIIYVCCPPCTKKIAADPETFLTKLDKLYVESLSKK